MGHYSASPGSIYPALARLERRRLLKGTVERRASLRPRKTYALTPDGRQTLRAWLLRPVTRDDVLRDADGLMLRFGLMGHAVGTADVLRFLDELATATQGVIEIVSAHQRRLPLKTTRGVATGHLALGYGLTSLRGLLAWARRSVAAIQNAR